MQGEQVKEQTPTSCTECSNKKYCWGYYCGMTCKYREQILKNRDKAKEREIKKKE